MSVSAGSTISGNGSCRLRNSEDGVREVGKVGVEVMPTFYFAPEIRGSVKHLSGNKDDSTKRGVVSLC